MIQIFLKIIPQISLLLWQPSQIDAFLAENGPVPEGQEEAARAQVAEQLRSQKFSTAAQSYVTGLRTQANIQYLVNYK